MSNPGWKCPGCGKCYAPWVKECDRCPKLLQFGLGGNVQSNKVCPHCMEGPCSGESSGCPVPSYRPKIS